MRQTLAGRLRMVYTGDEGQEFFNSHAWRRLFEIRGQLVQEFILEFLSRWVWTLLIPYVFSLVKLDYWLGSARAIPDKGDLRDYWIKISSDRDFLGPAPSYVYIRDPVRRLCHNMISCSISGRGHAPEKVTGIDLFYLRSMDQGTANIPYLLAQHLFRYAEGRNNRARLSQGHFIRCPAAHFGLVSDEGLRGLLVITRELPMIDSHELVRFNICMRLGDTWAWVAQGPERQLTATAGAPKDAEGAHDEIKGNQAVLAPVQAPQPPPAAQPRTMPWRIERLEEEVHELRQSIVGLRRVVDRSISDQSRPLTPLLSVVHRCPTRGVPDDAIRRILRFGIQRIDSLYNLAVKKSTN
ncbi:hypothetical protein Tco_1425985, partial [Tanacetum coccineum]